MPEKVTFIERFTKNAWIALLLMLKDLGEMVTLIVQRTQNLPVTMEIDWFDFVLKAITTGVVYLVLKQLGTLLAETRQLQGDLYPLKTQLQVSLYIWDWIQTRRARQGTALYTAEELAREGEASVYAHEMTQLEAELTAALHQRFPELTGQEIQAQLDQALSLWRSR